MCIFIQLLSANCVDNTFGAQVSKFFPAFQVFSFVSLLPPCVRIGKALSYINKQYFSDASGNRGGAPNVAVVLVDGWPTDKVEEASRLARESGINIFFVTIEGPDDNEKQNLIEPNFVDKVAVLLVVCQLHRWHMAPI